MVSLLTGNKQITKKIDYTTVSALEVALVKELLHKNVLLYRCLRINRSCLLEAAISYERAVQYSV